MIDLISYGNKYGWPIEEARAKHFDARALPNPFWRPTLYYLNGRDERVQKYVLSQRALALDILWDVMQCARKQHVAVVYCTGGRHRSVAVAEVAATMLRALGYEVAVWHRDIDKE